MKGRSSAATTGVSASASILLSNGDSGPTSSTMTVSPSSSNLTAADDGQYQDGVSDDRIVQWLLKTIDVIRYERQRPSLERIVHKMKFKHNIDEDIVQARLEEAVKSGRIIKIYNQGFLAYNDPVQLRKLANRSLKVTDSTDFSRVVVRCIREINEPSSVTDLERFIRRTFNLFIEPDVDLEDLVLVGARKAAEQGTLVETRNTGCSSIFNLVTRSSSSSSTADGSVLSLSKSTNDYSSKALKGAKMNHPNEQAADAHKKNCCSVCNGSDKSNSDGVPEDLLTCANCGKRGHPSCFHYTSELSKSLLSKSSSWYCSDCKRCKACNCLNSGNFIVCDGCDAGYHRSCATSNLPKKSNELWLCGECKAAEKKKHEKKLTQTAAANVKKRYKNAQRLKQTQKHSSKSQVPFTQSEFVSSDEMAASMIGESKGLIDSLSAYFTPTNKRQSRVAQASFMSRPNFIQQSSDESEDNSEDEEDDDEEEEEKEDYEDSVGVVVPGDQPSTSGQHRRRRRRRRKLTTRRGSTTRTNQLSGLIDGLSHRYAPSEDSRKRAAPGSYLHLVKGVASRSRSNSQPRSPSILSSAMSGDESTRRRKKCELDQGSAVETMESGDPSGAVPASAGKRTKTGGRKRSKMTTEKEEKASSSRSQSKNLDQVDTSRKLVYSSCFSDESEREEPPAVNEDDQDLMSRAQKKAMEVMSVSLLDLSARCPSSIQIGKWEIETWYSAPYPQEYARLPKLYICEFCLKYMKSGEVMHRHMSKCTIRNPPGNEIYRKNGLSVFEVDGNVSKIYCQNLCLLAKLFLDHKTLYYDVEPFLFYILTRNDDTGLHWVGYFSKEKFSAQKYNVSCIVTLPCYQQRGYGKFLIDFSYLLSRRENQPGTPEKPLSDLGRVSYQSYWKNTILEYFHKHRSLKKATVRAISRSTGMTPVDIVDTLNRLQFLHRQDGRLSIEVNSAVVEAHWKKSTSDGNRIWLDPDALLWHPVILSPGRELNKPFKRTRASDEVNVAGRFSPPQVASALKKRRDGTKRKGATEKSVPQDTATDSISRRKKGRARKNALVNGVNNDENAKQWLDSDSAAVDISSLVREPLRSSKKRRRRTASSDSDLESAPAPLPSDPLLSNGLKASGKKRRTSNSLRQQIESSDSEELNDGGEHSSQRHCRESPKRRRRSPDSSDSEGEEREVRRGVRGTNRGKTRGSAAGQRSSNSTRGRKSASGSNRKRTQAAKERRSSAEDGMEHDHGFSADEESIAPLTPPMSQTRASSVCSSIREAYQSPAELDQQYQMTKLQSQISDQISDQTTLFAGTLSVEATTAPVLSPSPIHSHDQNLPISTDDDDEPPRLPRAEEDIGDHHSSSESMANSIDDQPPKLSPIYCSEQHWTPNDADDNEPPPAGFQEYEVMNNMNQLDVELPAPGSAHGPGPGPGPVTDLPDSVLDRVFIEAMRTDTADLAPKLKSHTSNELTVPNRPIYMEETSPGRLQSPPSVRQQMQQLQPPPQQRTQQGQQQRNFPLNSPSLMDSPSSSTSTILNRSYEGMELQQQQQQQLSSCMESPPRSAGSSSQQHRRSVDQSTPLTPALSVHGQRPLSQSGVQQQQQQYASYGRQVGQQNAACCNGTLTRHEFSPSSTNNDASFITPSSISNQNCNVYNGPSAASSLTSNSNQQQQLSSGNASQQQQQRQQNANHQRTSNGSTGTATGGYKLQQQQQSQQQQMVSGYLAGAPTSATQPAHPSFITNPYSLDRFQHAYSSVPSSVNHHYVPTPNAMPAYTGTAAFVGSAPAAAPGYGTAPFMNAAAQYPTHHSSSPAAAYTYKNASGVPQATPDMVSSLNHNFYVNQAAAAAYMPQSMFAGAGNTPTGYFATSPFMTPGQQQMPMTGFPSVAFATGQPTTPFQDPAAGFVGSASNAVGSAGTAAAPMYNNYGYFGQQMMYGMMRK